MPNSICRVVLHGASGRMGRALAQCADGLAKIEVVGAVSADAVGQHIGRLAGLADEGPQLVASLDQVEAEFDAVIDFSRPAGTLAALDVCKARHAALVVGTTGFDEAQRQTLEMAARDIPICVAANFSIGVNVCLKLLRQAATALGDDYDVEVIEAHHRHKVDAPSGTALRMGQELARSLGRELDTDGVFSRHGDTGERPARAIGFSTIRGGDIIGEHTVLFAGDGERIEISHKATSRNNFANGALRAARWLKQQVPGYYDMSDVLGL